MEIVLAMLFGAAFALGGLKAFGYEFVRQVPDARA